MLKQDIAGETFYFRNSAELNEKAKRRLEEKEKLLETAVADTKRLKKEIKTIRKFLGVGVPAQMGNDHILSSPVGALS